MKYLSLLFLSMLVLATSCKKDEPDPQVQNLLFWDGENNTAPAFPAGQEYEPAVFFPSSVTSDFTARQLIAVDFVAYTPPARGTVFVYEGGSNSPTNIIAEQSFTASDLRDNSWNRIEFSNPATINGTNLWIGINFELTSQQQVIGCDAGPNQSGGDWLYESNDNSWRTYRDRSGGESINWNIRGVVSEQ
ncbi:MAG: hypothetical protein AAGK97_02595 [Bacteroidota bacterium]